MRNVLLVLLLIPAAVAYPNDGEKDEESLPPFTAVGVVTLREAVAGGELAAAGEKPRSYKGVDLVLRNRTERRLAIDVCGSYLRPRRRGSVQRLGLGPAVDPLTASRRGGGTVVVNLEPREIRRVAMNTVCLDSGRPAPGSHTFVAATDPLPPVREKVLRWWADNPHVSQGAVNSAIWQFREEVVIPVGDREPKGRFAAARAGTYYRLHDGELTSLDFDGVRRFLGTQIYRVIPTDGAVYAVAVGEDARPELWRLAMTGEKPWGRVAAVDRRLAIRDVFSGKAGIFLVTSFGVFLIDPDEGAARTVLADAGRGRLTAWPTSGGRLLVGATRPGQGEFRRAGEDEKGSASSFVLSTVDLATGRAEEVRRFWTVKEMSVGPAGVYGISHKGRLRKLVGKSFKTFGSTEIYDRILGVGKKGVWLGRASDGKVVYADAASGSVRHVTELGASLAGVRLDPVTDDLVLVSGEKFLRVSGEDGTVETVADQ